MNSADKLDVGERSRQGLEMMAKLDAKLQSLGIKRKSAKMAMADLTDLYFYANDVRRDLEQLLEKDISLPETAHTLVDLRVRLGEMRDHIGHARPALDHIADVCYKRLPHNP